MKKALSLLVVAIMCIGIFAGCGADPYITEDEAKAAVMEKAGGGSVESIALDSVEGFKIYAGTAVNGSDTYEFQVDAESGTVVSWLKNGETAKTAPVIEEL